MSLNYFLSCRKNYITIIQKMEYIIEMFDDNNYLSLIELEEFPDTYNEIMNQNNVNKYFFIDKLEHLKNLRAVCNNKIEQLCCHNYIHDTIDITLERSQNIIYCTICETLKDE